MCNCKCGKIGLPCGANSAVDMHRMSPDTMRHGGFNFEIRGSDRAYPKTNRDGSFAGGIYPDPNPCTNQAGVLAPRYSVYFQTMKAAAGGIFIREMNPVQGTKGFPNNVGTNMARPARNITVVADPGYDGILPISQQPKITKPLPY